MCEGPDLNRGTPARTDLESVAFDRAWLPSREGVVNVENIIKILRAKVNKRKAPCADCLRIAPRNDAHAIVKGLLVG